MYTLYIDTHFVKIVMGLFKNEELIDCREVQCSKHTTIAVNLLNTLLLENDLGIDDLEEVIVINGPGSFTGVRIGIVIAKMLGYTKNIPIKTLSYLEALALNYDIEVVLGIEDKNGVFGGRFNKDHELEGDYFYLNKNDVQSYKDKIIITDEVDLMKVISFMKKREPVISHLLKPLYVKKIEVEK